MIKTRLLKLMGSSGKHIIFQVLCRWISLIFQIVIIYIVARLSSTALKLEADPKTVTGFMLIAVLLAFGKAALDKMYVRASFNASADVKRVLRRAIYEKLLAFGSNYREFIGSAEITQLMTEGVEQLETYYGKYLSQFFYSILAPVTLFLALLKIDVLSSAILLIAVPLIPITIVIVMKIAKRLLSKYWGRYADLADSFLDNLNGLTTLKIYDMDGEYAARMDEESEEFRKVTMKVLTMQLNSTSVMDIIAYGGAAVGIITALTRYASGSIDIQGMLMIILLAAEFFLPMRRLGSYFHVAMNGMTASDRIFSFLDISIPEHSEEMSFDKGFDIVMKNVSFKYSDGRNALEGINASFSSGSFYAVTGASGSGKSTLAKILSGINRGYKGEITIGGNELFLIPREQLGSIVTLVKHDSFLFKGTVRDNMRMACPKVTDSRINKLLKTLSLDDVLSPDSHLEEGGSNLSGGQRQRLALARAVIYDSPVYIFDEATSNIDRESEKIFLSLAKKMAKDKVVIYISHRLKNAVDADMVYLMNSGCITSSGKHETLLKNSDLYAEMFESQSELESITEDNKTEKQREYIVNHAIFLEDDKNTEENKPEYSADEHYSDIKNDYETDETDDYYDEPEEESVNVLYIIKNMMKLLKPLIPVMCIAVILGTVGFLLAISVTVLAGKSMITEDFSFVFFIIILAAALLRGFLHYGEQYCNHYIAFKILALIRHKIFEKLRSLAPAVLERKDKGNLIALITSDVEKLEVFYAHTVSPVMIAFLVSGIVTGLVMSKSLLAGAVILLGFYIVGVLIPLINGKRRKKSGISAAVHYGDMNSVVLESLYGLDETIQYGDGIYRLDHMEYEASILRKSQEELSRHEENQTAVTGLAIELCSFAVILIAMWQVSYGAIWPEEYIFILTLAMGSFGPVVALSSLSNDLSNTFASGERVINLLNETPKVIETPEYAEEDSETSEKENKASESVSDNISMEEVSFSYGDRFVLKDVSFGLPENNIIGLVGKSGSGKSTLLRLMMRFWDPQYGKVCIGNENVKDIPGVRLRDREAFVTQDTVIFNDTVWENIAIGRYEASDEDIMEAARKAAIHDFILTLPEGYDTKLGEGGNALSDGEKQRIGLARAFLHDADIMLLDEPTSNLDALNEGIILRSIKNIKDRTVIMVSHRESSLCIADKVYELKNVDKT